MHIPKRYGSYQQKQCPFCYKNAVTENPQKVPVCTAHKKQSLPDQKCICGNWLELKAGKFGPYFNCMKCGNKNFNKVSLILPRDASKPVKPSKEIVIRSDDPLYFS